MKYAVWALLVLLTLVQQDYLRWWDEPRLVLGFLPLPLAVHMLVSVAAAGLWLAATKFCWPEHLEPETAGEGEAQA